MNVEQKTQLDKLNADYMKLNDLYEQAKAEKDIRAMGTILHQMYDLLEKITELRQGINIEWRFHKSDCQCDDCLRAVDAYLGN